MNVSRAVITAAGPKQRALPLQLLVDRDGRQKAVLRILVEEAVRAGIHDVCVVIHPGDEEVYAAAADGADTRLCFIPQTERRGYGHAVYMARDFVGDAPFLHLVGDHIYVSARPSSCAEQLVAAASQQNGPVSGVQPTRENQLPYFGAIGGHRVAGRQDLYQIETVVEKPSPTEAEQNLAIPGLRAGHYLCFFGMHVLTPTIMGLLQDHIAAQPIDDPVQLSPILAKLAERERYLALEVAGARYAVDGRFGLLYAQLALALSGDDRSEVLSGVCELLAQREMERDGHARA